MRSGLDVLIASNFAGLRGDRLGLIAHPASVESNALHAADDILADRLAVLFGPEHGRHGAAQDLIPVGEQSHERYRVVSLYGDTFESLKPTDDHLAGLDALAIDLQDVGSRYYTFQATMLYALEAAARNGVRVAVLDRPNPLGGVAVEGPTLQPGYESFVGPHPIPTRHGLTMGELARLYRAERGIDVDLDVIRCEGWRRDATFDRTGLPWVMPSPNMPTLDTAFVYPGQCLLEGTNLSEGRGTTRPFEICGAPWIDGRRLHEHAIPGAILRPATFQPTFQKHAGMLCGGVQLHVVDRTTFQPVRAGLALLAALRSQGGGFDWRREPYEFVADRLAIDLLFGSDRERRALEAGADVEDIARTWEDEECAFRERRRPYLLYES